jgi:hypothetical protein
VNAAGDPANGGNTVCDLLTDLCAANYSVSSNHTCVKCANGTWNEYGDVKTGNKTFCNAIRCLANQRVVSNNCVACQAGAWATAGAFANGTNTNCTVTPCVTGYRVLNFACAKCSSGQTNVAGDLPTGANTVCDCANGTMANANNVC